MNSTFENLIPMKSTGTYQMNEFIIFYGGITKSDRFSEYLNDLLVFNIRKCF